MPPKNRYPGVKPFETDDKPIFFGRSADIDKFYEMISVEKTVLLYSESGLGKTSLINAGLIPLLIKKRNNNYFTVRLGAYSENNKISPKEKIIEILQEKSAGSSLLKINELKENSIGYWFKAIQLLYPDKSNILIFDQFEELFTYPDYQITELKKELNELVYLKASPSFRKNIISLSSQKSKIFSKEEFNTLNSALNIHLIFSIRSDSLSYLNQLTDYLPNLQLTFYHLNPIKEEDARSAIKSPANCPGEFASPKFEFTAEAVDKIINELSNNGENPIATFQLQIVCQYAEKLVLDDPSHLKLKIVPDDLGNIQAIHQRFYDNLIDGIPYENDEEKIKLRDLLETQFIYEPEKRRWQVLENVVQNTITEKALKILVDSHLIRRESFQKTFIYELSHDTLVEPILKSYHLRKNKEEQEKAEQKRKQEQERAEQKRKEELEKVELRRIVELEKAERRNAELVQAELLRTIELEKAERMNVELEQEKLLRTVELEKAERRNAELEQAEQKKQAALDLLKEKNLRQRKQKWTLVIAAIICFGFALFGIISWKFAVNEQSKSKKSSYDRYFSLGQVNQKTGNYPEAIQNYYAAKVVADDTLIIIDLIKYCKGKQDSSEIFKKLISTGDSLQSNENTYSIALENYDNALKLQVNDTLAHQRINELKSKINITVAKIKNRATYLIDANGCREARKILLFAQQLKPDDTEIKSMLIKCEGR